MALELVYVEPGYWAADYVQTGVTMDWAASIIFIPKESLTLIQSSPTEVRQLNLDDFRRELKNLEDSSQGMAWTKTHNHNTTVTVGGVVLARVIEILDPWTITFEDGQYAVNLVGANSNVGDKVNVNQVSVRSANSAGLQDLSTLLTAAYQGEVAIDVINGQPGTSTPIGTRRVPCSNFEDAHIIASNIGAGTFRIIRDMTLGANAHAEHRFISDNAAKIILTVDAAADVNDAQFQDLTILGTLDGFTTVRDCRLINATVTSGFIFRSAIVGTLTTTAGQILVLIDCFSDSLSIGSDTIIDLDGTSKVEIINFNGEMTLTNYTGGASIIEIFINSGKITLDSTITGGTIHAYGNGSIINNSVGATVIDDTSGLKISNIHKRLDLDTNKPNVYTEDAGTGRLTQVVNDDFTLTSTKIGNDTTVQRS